MKSIGPYVAARELTGQRPLSVVRTLHATDRLTGMPVLLHVLPHPVPLPALPADPALLAPSDGGITGETAYLLTELPPHARPATDPTLAARGGLRALAALHGAGLTHGGVSSAQLWEVDGRVVLVGAGLPWGGESSPAADLRELLVALEMLGGVPPALQRVALDDTSARELLESFDAVPAGPAPVLGSLPPTREAPTSRPASTARPPALVTLPDPEPALPAHDGSPIVLSGALADTLWNAENAPAKPPAPPPPAVESPFTPDTLMEDSALLVVTPAPPAPAPVGRSDPPPGPAERELLAGDQGKLPEDTHRVIRAVGEGATAPQVAVGSARTAARRVGGEPVRIVWNPDGTRRVVKEGVGGPPPPRRYGPARFPWPLLAVLALLLALGGGFWAWKTRASVSPSRPVTLTPSASRCCPVTFKVSGNAGVPVRLEAVSTPAGTGWKRGDKIGRAPGTVRLPQPGTYVLRVSAQGYRPVTVTVQVPEDAVVPIGLAP
ncbi:PEGA domain-containing protein [Deinococcus hopiensis]|uniref:PEGA domain-containing protein n=1 Tax=Deinococcus hopiensis TaxID=309885 RepID=UPI001481FA49|nr:PEGA domain-containing protein [Deinococcus hopiensis]